MADLILSLLEPLLEWGVECFAIHFSKVLVELWREVLLFFN